MKYTQKTEINKGTFYQMDCMDLLKDTPDNFYELAIVDPPYGIGISRNPVRQQQEKKQWDNAIPDKEYFDELFRVSKNQIIWGGNYFIEYLQNTRCFICWDKKQSEKFSLAMCEMAWTSFDETAKCFYLRVVGADITKRIHPTQKPVTLYKWLLKNYAKEGDKILDTHLGSGSIAIACHYMGFELTGCELDEEYYNQSMERIKGQTLQKLLI